MMKSFSELSIFTKEIIMFACTSMAGMAMTTGPTDTCKTPTPAGPQPMPYPNMAQLAMADSGTVDKQVTVLGAPVLTAKSKITMSNGDEPGVAGGIVSNKNMGECTFKTSSQKVSFHGQPAVFMTCQTGHNGPSTCNTMGQVTVPSQSFLNVS